MLMCNNHNVIFRRSDDNQASYSFDSELFIAIKLSIYEFSRCDSLLSLAYFTAGLPDFMFFSIIMDFQYPCNL